MATGAYGSSPPVLRPGPAAVRPAADPPSAAGRGGRYPAHQPRRRSASSAAAAGASSSQAGGSGTDDSLAPAVRGTRLAVMVSPNSDHATWPPSSFSSIVSTYSVASNSSRSPT